MLDNKLNMEVWAFAIRIGVVFILLCISGDATATSAEVSQADATGAHLNLDRFPELNFYSDGQLGNSLGDSGDVLPDTGDVSADLEDVADPAAGPSLGDMGSNVSLDTAVSSHETELRVTDEGNLDLDTASVSISQEVVSDLEADKGNAEDVEVSEDKSGKTSEVEGKALEDQDETYEDGHNDGYTSGAFGKEGPVSKNTDKAETTGKALEDEDKAPEEDGNVNPDISEAYTKEDPASENIDTSHINNSEIILINSEGQKVPTSVETLFEPRDRTILIKVPDERPLPAVSPLPATTLSSQEGVMVYNGKVYPGKVCETTVEQESGDLEMPPQPWDPTCKAWSWAVTVGDGFFADVTLESLDINHEADEFMIIGPGSSVAGLWEDESNPIFTSVITTEKKFRMLEASTFTVLLVTNTPSGFTGGFKLSYERAEKVGTTPLPTTPVPTLPSPAENVTTEIRVYMSGKTAEEFNQTSVEFRQVVADMSNIYCEENDIPMRNASTYQNVVLSLIRQCDMTWPHHDNCVQVNMSVAVIMLTNQPLAFELTAVHLQDMWDTKAGQPDSGLEELGLTVYSEPDHRANLIIWLGVSLCVLIIFIAILILVWRMEIFRDYSRMVGKRDSAFSHRSSTMSDDSWFPDTEHQLVPPYMDMYSEVGYVEYEPEFNGPVPMSKYQKPIGFTVEKGPAYNGPPPRYGPPPELGLSHFYGNTKREFDNPAFVEEDEDNVAMEEEVNTGQQKIGWLVKGKNKQVEKVNTGQQKFPVDWVANSENENKEEVSTGQLKFTVGWDANSENNNIEEEVSTGQLKFPEGWHVGGENNNSSC